MPTALVTGVAGFMNLCHDKNTLSHRYIFRGIANPDNGTEEDLVPVQDDPHPRDICHSVADISKVNKSNGFDPDTSFTEGVERTVEWFGNQ